MLRWKLEAPVGEEWRGTSVAELMTMLGVSCCALRHNPPVSVFKMIASVIFTTASCYLFQAVV